MTDTRTMFDDIEVINPILVIKFGLVYDYYKRDLLDKLWKNAEKLAPTKMSTFKADELFFQEEIQQGDIWYSFRFYTPKSNIKGG